MTQNIVLKEMTTDREKLRQYHDSLENWIKDKFIVASGESAITVMTRTVRDNDPKKKTLGNYIRCFGYISYGNGKN